METSKVTNINLNFRIFFKIKEHITKEFKKKNPKQKHTGTKDSKGLRFFSLLKIQSLGTKHICKRKKNNSFETKDFPIEKNEVLEIGHFF